ncbi:hypothetical protein BN1013_01756 [Candidatus Rubidus massiliensis]|nr:hypothetical protein BN1013_01756 [Candidatus Rubidus massiliensis]
MNVRQSVYVAPPKQSSEWYCFPICLIWKAIKGIFKAIGLLFCGASNSRHWNSNRTATLVPRDNQHLNGNFGFNLRSSSRPSHTNTVYVQPNNRGARHSSRRGAFANQRLGGYGSSQGVYVNPNGN